MIDVEQENLREALKRVAVALKEIGLPFALAGGYASWARGGPEPEHDVDFVVAEEDAPQVASLLAERGFQVVQPPEDWLFKVFTDDVMVDVIHRDATIPAERAMLADADHIEVISVVMPVLPATRLMVQKLHAMDERYCDFGRLMPVARALREQVDWDVVRAETDDNAFAVAFLFLLERLSII
ncbi:nucleotidyltransferase family protein [Nocardioides houyundeii]|uniref:nucleotidyltransferase family protein n=1 Tax=Nocardioides houyundeii TaxID=2045452 RepID=UPI000C75D5AC|nr:nucleotidyltransferase family protein [Nocardioides houyundeii]